MTLEDAPFPSAVDFDLPGDDLVGAPAVPEVIEPLALVEFAGGIVVVGADAIAEVVLEGAVVVVAVGVMHGALEGSRGVEVVALEALSPREEEGLLHGLHSYILNGRSRGRSILTMGGEEGQGGRRGGLPGVELLEVFMTI